jgi:redox-sensitive bicupin YhaK (pirin superfamily)
MPAATADALTLPRFAAAPTAASRSVLSVTRGPRAFEGEGFPVRRAFAGVPSDQLDPFIHMDQMGEVEYGAGEPKGTPWHPHRGFETFTYLIDGQFLHQDSNAGDGILHIETPPEALVESGGLFHGVQLWINLPRAKKRIAPQYQDLQGNDSVMVASADGGSYVRVLAGAVGGHQGPGISHTPLAITHVTVAPGGSISIPWPSNFNALAYVLAGSGAIGAEQRIISEGQLAVLVNGDLIQISADAKQDSRTENLEIFLIGGVPLREPVVAYGPFVMSTTAEIQEAFEDYQKGRLGSVPANALQPHRAGNN